ncbi:hypothetical protein [Agrobacterium sp. SORGH_AS 787]|uniref:hypothetical protein n=1 Tax=Agrobacterium sp. SORGH_AS 787 TaxID=3041775 RepID=UPI00277F1F83|nr:hypothetical protein [Rhizobium sp. SORGH_AS_0787]
MSTIDICLVAGRRPDLLKTTLQSFNASVFQNFEVANFYANIDPIFGDTDDEKRTQDVIRSFFPDAHIRAPESPNFCTAVKQNWLSTRSPFVFHFEDDWVVNQEISSAEILEIFSDKNVGQVSLNHFYKNWNYKHGHYHRQWPRWKVFGIKFKLGFPFPCFTTSPSFLKGDFARKAAALMDDRYDPEKQFHSLVNRPLVKFVRPYKNFIYGEGKPYVITDTGRDWRDERKIKKTLLNSTSVWETTES